FQAGPGSRRHNCRFGVAQSSQFPVSFLHCGKLLCVEALITVYGAGAGLRLGAADAIPERGRACSMSHAVNSHPIIAVTCLSFEAQVAAGPGIDVLCGTAQRYVDKLESAVKAGGSGIISIGIAGALAPGLNPGDWVIASGVVAEGIRIATNNSWSQRLLQALPSAVYADISGVDAPGVAQAAKG